MPRQHWASRPLHGHRARRRRAADAARRDLEPVEAGRRLDRMAPRRNPPVRLTGSRHDAAHPRSRSDPRSNREPRARPRSLGAAAARRARGPDVRHRRRARRERVRDRRKRARSPRRCRRPHAGPHAAAFPARRPRVPGRSDALGSLCQSRGRPGAGVDAEGSRADDAVARRAGVRERAGRRSSGSASPISGAVCLRFPNTRANASATASRATRASGRECLPRATKAARSRSRSARSPHASTRSRRASMRSRARLPDSVVAAKFGKKKGRPPQTV